MHLDDAPRDGLITVSDDDVLDLELIRRRLIGRHHDIRLLTYRHDPNLTGLRRQRRNSSSDQTRPAAGRSKRTRRADSKTWAPRLPCSCATHIRRSQVLRTSARETTGGELACSSLLLSPGS